MGGKFIEIVRCHSIVTCYLRTVSFIERCAEFRGQKKIGTVPNREVSLIQGAVSLLPTEAVLIREGVLI